MPLTPEQRAELIDGLIENCDCWSDEDRELLNGFKDVKLRSFTENLSRTSKSKNESTQTETLNLEELSMSDLQNEMKRRKDMVGNEEKPTENETKTAVPTEEKEWIEKAPDTIKNTFRYAHAIEKEQKEGLVAQITAHITDNAEKQIQADRLMSRTLDDLRADAALIPTQNTEEKKEESKTINEEKSLLDRVLNSLNPTPADEPLVAPTMTFGEDEGESVTVNAMPIAGNEAEWIKSAPPRIRQILTNALDVERTQKDEIITKLVSNVGDTNQRFRMRDRLGDKPLDELKEMLSLVGDTTQPKKSTPNYAGASTPVTSNKLSDEEKHDVLPLPTMTFDMKTG